MPRLSVVMAVHDSARFLRAAIDSVLSQTVEDLELVVVNDASTDGSRDIAADCGDRRLVLLDNPTRLGLAASLNRGLGAARSDLIARQDADDVSHPRRLERQLAVLRARPELALMGTRARRIDADGAPVGVVDRPLDPGTIRWYHLFSNPFVHSAVMFRRAAVADVGGYDESFTWAQDFELWSRVLHRYPVLNLPDRLVDYRDHPGSTTAGGRDPARYAALVRHILARNVEATLGESLDQTAVAVLSGFDLGLDRADVDRFVALTFHLAGVFRRRWPEATGGLERTLAGQLDALAARVRPPTRAAAFAVYRSGVAADPHLLRWLPWARALGRLALGPARLRRLRPLARWRTARRGAG